MSANDVVKHVSLRPLPLILLHMAAIVSIAADAFMGLRLIAGGKRLQNQQTEADIRL